MSSITLHYCNILHNISFSAEAFHKTEHSTGIPPTWPSNFILLMDFPTVLLGDQETS